MTIMSLLLASKGGTGASAALADRTIDSTASTGTRDAGFKVLAAGTTQQLQGIAGGAYSATGETWMLALTGSAYDIRATLSSGDAMAVGTMGTWLSMASDRTWEQQCSVAGTFKDSLVLFEIRDAVTLVVLDTANITFHAERL